MSSMCKKTCPSLPPQFKHFIASGKRLRACSKHWSVEKATNVLRLKWEGRLATLQKSAPNPATSLRIPILTKKGSYGRINAIIRPEFLPSEGFKKEDLNSYWSSASEQPSSMVFGSYPQSLSLSLKAVTVATKSTQQEFVTIYLLSSARIQEMNTLW